jgi:predicted enzyme related to lactoylglutathione lyase
MARVIGIGGIFFKSRDKKALSEWYGRVLGIAFEPWGGAVLEPDGMAKQPGAGTVFSPFDVDTTYFEPSTKDYMINFAVDDLEGMLARAAEHGVVARWRDDNAPNGRFAHIVDPEGNKIELWEPKE